MNNNTPFHESDGGQTLNGPTVKVCMQKAPWHIFRIHTYKFATTGIKGSNSNVLFPTL